MKIAVTHPAADASLQTGQSVPDQSVPNQTVGAVALQTGPDSVLQTEAAHRRAEPAAGDLSPLAS